MTKLNQSQQQILDIDRAVIGQRKMSKIELDLLLAVRRDLIRMESF